MPRKTNAIRQFVATGIAVFAFLFIVAKCTGCNTPLTPAEQQSVAFDGVRIGVCQEVGRQCKRVDGGDCFDKYDACILDSGLREGSAR